MLHLIFTVLYCNGITSMTLSAWVCMLVLLQVAEDKTFGLKNKNKSAKVQQYAADLLFAHLPSEVGFIVGFALCASYSASAMRRYVQHVKKTVDDQVQKQKTAANATKVLLQSWYFNAMLPETLKPKCARYPFMFNTINITCCSITALL